jgi:hypothetical protein
MGRGEIYASFKPPLLSEFATVLPPAAKAHNILSYQAVGLRLGDQ